MYFDWSRNAPKTVCTLIGEFPLKLDTSCMVVLVWPFMHFLIDVYYLFHKVYLIFQRKLSRLKA